ncbi:MAG: hypothetical protein GVY04_09235 [Cyanobacteria bacterium]|jgi:hypothetical protein|nr:hypothetical protein [Cyanobacteria bacterium GSL.Bin1]
MLKTFQQIPSNPLIAQARRFSFCFRSLVAREPALSFLYQPYLWWGQIKRKAAGHNLEEGLLLPDTQLVIDGFQGSANSFAASAFINSQTQTVKVMHHRHAPFLIIQAIEQKIPVLLTIRQPKETVLSLTSRWPHISINDALRSYIGFYRKLLPYAPNLIVSDFDLTTQHLDCVVQTLNTKYDTNFDRVDIARVNIERNKKTVISSHRKAIKEEKRKEFQLAENIQLLKQAEEVYQEFEKFSRQIKL